MQKIMGIVSWRATIWVLLAGVLPFCTVWFDLKFIDKHGSPWMWLAVLQQLVATVWLVLSDKSRALVAIVVALVWFVMFWILALLFIFDYVCRNYGNCL